MNELMVTGFAYGTVEVHAELSPDSKPSAKTGETAMSSIPVPVTGSRLRL